RLHIRTIYVSTSHIVLSLSSSTLPSTPATSTLSLHDALPISGERARHITLCQRALHVVAVAARGHPADHLAVVPDRLIADYVGIDRKSTRLNSSHLVISYAVFCLKKKNHVRRNFELLMLHFAR